MFEKFAEEFAAQETPEGRARVVERFAQKAVRTGSSLGSYDDLLAAGAFILSSVAGRRCGDA